MSLDLTSFDSALKAHYTADRVLDLVYKDNPLFAIMPKYEEFTGKNLPIVMIHGNPQGRSKTFTNAQTRGNVTSSLVKDFVLTRVQDYSLATIDNETLEASKGSAGAFMEAATTEIDGAINALTRSIAIGMYRDSSAEIGQVSAEPSTAGTTTVTLKSPGDVTNFELDQIVNIWSAKSGGSQKSSDGTITSFTITAVDRSNGTFTASAAYDASGTIAADDFIFVEGDRGLGISGLAGWVPETAPSATPFFGVDRSVDTQRLGGVRHDGSAQPIDEALIDGASAAAREGGKVDHAFLSYKQYAALEKALGSKVQYVDLRQSAEVGFRGIEVNGPRGMIKVIPDQNCPDDTCYMLQMDTWKLYSLGKAVRSTSADGLDMLRQAAADGVEVRYAFYGNVGCKAPGWNVNVKL